MTQLCLQSHMQSYRLTLNFSPLEGCLDADDVGVAPEGVVAVGVANEEDEACCNC